MNLHSEHASPTRPVLRIECTCHHLLLERSTLLEAMPAASSLSPQPPAAPTPTMAGSGGGARPPLMKRQSSQSSNQSSRQTVVSPGSVDHQPLRHHVKKHAKIILPRNHSSGRNLAKLNRQAQSQHVEEYRKHGRQRSHEGKSSTDCTPRHNTAVKIATR